MIERFSAWCARVGLRRAARPGSRPGAPARVHALIMPLAPFWNSALLDPAARADPYLAPTAAAFLPSLLLSEAVIAVIALGLVALVIALRVRRRRRPDGRGEDIDPRDMPPLLFAPDPAATKVQRGPPPPARPPPPAWEPRARAVPGTRPAGPAAVPGPAGGARPPKPPAGVARPETAARPKRPTPAAPAGDGTLQLLPGRLEYLNGRHGQEIRFVRTEGEARFTIGRSPGEPHSHVQINAPTVSRMHAYMRFDAGVWTIGNLSQTNHVVVNGEPLEVDAERVLEDGDRIEMGEVTLVFRAR